MIKTLHPSVNVLRDRALLPPGFVQGRKVPGLSYPDFRALYSRWTKQGSPSVIYLCPSGPGHKGRFYALPETWLEEGSKVRRRPRVNGTETLELDPLSFWLQNPAEVAVKGRTPTVTLPAPADVTPGQLAALDAKLDLILTQLNALRVLWS